jgi:uroporphyrinogen III methyltransferase/synthase
VEALAEELPQKLEKGERVLLLRAQQGSEELNRIWDEKGIAYEDLGIYRIDADTRMVKQLLADSGTLDTITFASSSGVTAFMEELKAYEKEGGSFSFSGKYVCIGHKTAETLESYLPKDRDRILTAREYTAEGLMAACLENKERKESGT